MWLMVLWSFCCLSVVIYFDYRARTAEKETRFARGIVRELLVDTDGVYTGPTLLPWTDLLVAAKLDEWAAAILVDKSLIPKEDA